MASLFLAHGKNIIIVGENVALPNQLLILCVCTNTYMCVNINGFSFNGKKCILKIESEAVATGGSDLSRSVSHRQE